jgi:tRNA(Ile)-lysidine synthase
MSRAAGGERSLEARFAAHFRSLRLERAGPLVVAVSGGCDSVTLLFLLRFCLREPHLRLVVAHLDHAMRPGSEGDARWVAGLCAAWQLPLVRHRLPHPPRGEAEARVERYAFLRRAAADQGARYILTAHHADDQAETVLYRALRGAGLAGLGGMAAVSDSGVVRPLLPFWREEIERFARARDVRWRSDPTNRSPDVVRNRIRLSLLPWLEREVAPGARRSLVSLAALAREAEATLEREAERAACEVAHEEKGVVVLARPRMRDYDSATGSRILRKLLRRFGVVLSRTGTRTALQFITDAASGRELQLPGGVRIRLEFEVARIAGEGPPPEDVPFQLTLEQAAARVQGSATIGGQCFGVAAGVAPWQRTDAPEPAERAALPLAALCFPLTLRGWQPGDRMATAGGTKTLKKLFLEHRIPRSQRHCTPVLVDAQGSVLWVVGIPRAPVFAPRPGEEALLLTVLYA